MNEQSVLSVSSAVNIKTELGLNGDSGIGLGVGQGSPNIKPAVKRLWLGRFNLLLAVLASLLMTMALLVFMHSLINSDELEPADETPPVSTQIYQEPKEITVLKEFKRPDEIPPPIEIPTAQVEIFEVNEKITFNHGGITDIGPITGPVSGIAQSGAIVKQVSVGAQYPRRAVTRGIEGYVDLMFDVTKYGATSNVRVTAAEPKGVFEKAAITAVKKYKYRPELVDGEPVATNNVTERIRFEMGK